MRKEATAEAYLSRDNPRTQTGHGGDEARWRYTRVMMILEALHKSGTFLDVGCANGYLIECLDRWVSGSGLRIDFYGVDISEELVAFARNRLPGWSDRLFTANAVEWMPETKYDIIHAHEISYAPEYKEREFLHHLIDDYLKPGGRLIVGPWAVGRDSIDLEQKLSAWNMEPTGYILKSQKGGANLTRKLIWFDKY